MPETIEITWRRPDGKDCITYVQVVGGAIDAGVVLDALIALLYSATAIQVPDEYAENAH